MSSPDLLESFWKIVGSSPEDIGNKKLKAPAKWISKIFFYQVGEVLSCLMFFIYRRTGRIIPT
jgi:hypothetical protein